MTVSKKSYERVIEDDGVTDSVDMCGVRARVILKIRNGAASYITQSIISPGLWDIDSGSAHGQYGLEVYAEQCEILTHMLTTIGITVTD